MLHVPFVSLELLRPCYAILRRHGYARSALSTHPTECGSSPPPANSRNAYHDGARDLLSLARDRPRAERRGETHSIQQAEPCAIEIASKSQHRIERRSPAPRHLRAVVVGTGFRFHLSASGADAASTSTSTSRSTDAAHIIVLVPVEGHGRGGAGAGVALLRGELCARKRGGAEGRM